MRLNTPNPTGSLRLAMLIAVSLPLACFKGDDGSNDSVANDESESGSTDTGDECPVATDGCPCTAGGGCDQGLECSDGVCGPIQAVCGNGQIEPGESCDDANDYNTDSCTTLCAAPSCEDGITSGDEVDVDCGLDACGVGCDFGQACTNPNDCTFPSCGPAPGGGEGMVCELPSSCAHWLTHNAGATDNTYAIDPDGAAGPIEPMDVFCHMTKNGGGWTLVFVASDDDVDTWTWNNRAKMASDPEPVGTLASRNLDFMSRAYRDLPFTDLLFIHQPSNVWANYDNVGDGSKSIATFIADIGNDPVCDYNMAGAGFPLAMGSTLTGSGELCMDTDLYFNLGDHESSLTECQDFGSNGNAAAFGPVWNADNGSGCPFDDPAEFGLGPHGPCGVCPDEFAATEFDYLGYASALNLNTGTKKVGQNYIQMYVR